LNGDAWRAAFAASPALATLTNGRPSARRPSSSRRVSVPVAGRPLGVDGHRPGPGGEPGGGGRVERDLEEAREVVGRARRDHRERHPQPARQLGGGADRAVAAGHGDPVRRRLRDPLEIRVLAAADLDLGALLAHGVGERLGVGAAPRTRVGREGDPHGA
jgi:hypothetical protein